MDGLLSSTLSTGVEDLGCCVPPSLVSGDRSLNSWVTVAVLGMTLALLPCLVPRFLVFLEGISWFLGGMSCFLFLLGGMMCNKVTQIVENVQREEGCQLHCLEAAWELAGPSVIVAIFRTDALRVDFVSRS